MQVTRCEKPPPLPRATSIDRLAPYAVAGLLKAWAKGNPAGALEVLTRLGFLRPTEVRVQQTGPMGVAVGDYGKLPELRRTFETLLAARHADRVGGWMSTD
jgi:hypothetical protein